MREPSSANAVAGATASLHATPSAHGTHGACACSACYVARAFMQKMAALSFKKSDARIGSIGVGRFHVSVPFFHSRGQMHVSVVQRLEGSTYRCVSACGRGYSNQYLLHQPSWQGSVNAVTAAVDNIHTLLVYKRPTPSWP